ncbi:MAG: hypothetical protein N2C14_21390 [Planctomycetales bacterium]
MLEFLQQIDGPTRIALAALVVLLIVGAYLIQKTRAGGTEDVSDTHSMLTNFREMYAQGELSDEEYRTIKSTLSTQLQEELQDEEETGTG